MEKTSYNHVKLTGDDIVKVKIGDKAFFEKTISESDVYLFAGLTGDFNPLHMNEEVAKKSIFKTRVVHGLIVAGLISAVLGLKLPGPGTIYLSQELRFVKPVRIGDTIRAEVEVIELLPKNRVKLKTICINQRGEVVIDGSAIVLVPE